MSLINFGYFIEDLAEMCQNNIKWHTQRLEEIKEDMCVEWAEGYHKGNIKAYQEVLERYDKAIVALENCVNTYKTKYKQEKEEEKEDVERLAE